MGSDLKKHMEWGSCYFQEFKSMDFKELPKLRDSISYIYIDHARVEQDNRSLVFICKDGKVPIPVAALTCIVLGPGTSITHAAVKTASENGCHSPHVCGDEPWITGHADSGLINSPHMCGDEPNDLEIPFLLLDIRPTCVGMNRRLDMICPPSTEFAPRVWG